MSLLKKEGAVIVLVFFACILLATMGSGGVCTNEIRYSGACTPNGTLALYVNGSLVKEWSSFQLDGGPCSGGTYSIKIGEGCNIHNGETASFTINSVGAGKQVWTNSSYNVTLNLDARNPVVTLIYPPSDLSDGPEMLNVSYKVNHSLAISECKLYVNNAVRAATNNPSKDTNLLFSTTLLTGKHEVYVGCTNNAGVLGKSVKRNVTVLADGTMIASWISPSSGLSVPQNQNFNITTRVTCQTGDCGTVTASLDPIPIEEGWSLWLSIKRIFNRLLQITGLAAGNLVSTTYQATPFYTTSSNPQSCGAMDAGDICTKTWKVYATGAVGSYQFFTIYNSTTLSTIETEHVTISIAVNNDTTAPVINLLNPANGGQVNSNIVSFEYKVVDNKSTIDMCKLLLDGTVSQTDTTVSENTTQLFIETLHSGNYSWAVHCRDNSLLKNNATTAARNVIVNGSDTNISVNCMTVLTKDTVLGADMSCNSTGGLIFGKDGITLDCNGHIIEGGGNNTNTGVLVSQKLDVTIKECNIRGFGKGLYFDRARESRAEYVSVSYSKTGLMIQNSTDNSFYRVSTHYNVVGANVSNSNGNDFNDGNVKNNKIVGISSTGNLNSYSLLDVSFNNGTGMSVSGNENKVLNNSVSNNSRRGVSVSGNNNLIQGNTLSNNPVLEGVGLFVDDGSSNTITKNIIKHNLRGLVIQNTRKTSEKNVVYANRFENNDQYHAETVSGNNFSVSIGVLEGKTLYKGNFWGDISGKQLDIYDINKDGYGDGGKDYPYSNLNGKVLGQMTDYGPQPALSSVPAVTAQAITQVNPCDQPGLKEICGDWGACEDGQRGRACSYSNGCDKKWTQFEACEVAKAAEEDSGLDGQVITLMVMGTVLGVLVVVLGVMLFNLFKRKQKKQVVQVPRKELPPVPEDLKQGAQINEASEKESHALSKIVETSALMPLKKETKKSSISDPRVRALFNKAYQAVEQKNIVQAQLISGTILAEYKRAEGDSKKEIFDELYKLYTEIEQISG